MVLDSGSFVAAIGSLRMKPRLWEFAKSPTLSGSLTWVYHVITTCDLRKCLAQLFVAKVHYNSLAIAIARRS
jgi:hypothetical protein